MAPVTAPPVGDKESSTNPARRMIHRRSNQFWGSSPCRNLPSSRVGGPLLPRHPWKTTCGRDRGSELIRSLWNSESIMRPGRRAMGLQSPSLRLTKYILPCHRTGRESVREMSASSSVASQSASQELKHSRLDNRPDSPMSATVQEDEMGEALEGLSPRWPGEPMSPNCVRVGRSPSGAR